MATILVVDDRPTNRELLKTILQYGGHGILEASDGREALDLTRSARPDLIISDILMPTMDGFEFVRRLRDDPVIGKTPVVFSSAHYLNREATALARTCGVDHILTKPIDPETILRTVDLALAPSPAIQPAHPNEFNLEHLGVLTDKLAEKVEQLEVANQRLIALNELGRTIGTERNSCTLLEAFCRDVRSIIGARFGAIGLVDEKGRTAAPLIWSGFASPPDIDARLVAGSGTLIERCLAERCPYRAAEIGPEAVGLTANHPRVQFALCAPIASPTCTYGWVCFTDKIGVGEFSENDEELLGSLTAQLGRAYENNILLARLQEHTAELELEVTQRKKTEKALRESELRYRQTFENAAVGLAHVGPDGSWVRVNRRLCEIIGYSESEMLGLRFQELTHPGDLETDLKNFNALLNGEISTYHREKRYMHKDGHAVWVNVTTSLQRDQAGRPLYCLPVIEDINARKHAEQALWDSENRMRALLDASQDEILLLSTEGVALAINKAAERRLAKRMGGANPVGAHLDRLLPEDQVELRMAIVRQVAATTTHVHREMQVRSRWFEFWYYPVIQPDKPVSEVALYAREITQQKKSQADLSKLFQAIQQSPTSVVITDRDGTIEYVNPKFTDVTGYTQAEAIGHNPRILKSGHTPAEQYVELWKTITSGSVWRGELFNKKKNGELFWELASIAPVKQGGTITNFVSVKEDITERKQVEEQLRQAQKMEAVGQLTGGIAHDFNNLLAIIIGNLQLLGERISGDAKTRDYLEDALWSARRGGELTHRLLAFARKQPLKPTFIDLNDVVGGMTELLRRTLGAGIRIEESLAPDLWKAFADRGELERALVNLAVNSRDAMRSGGTLTLETRNAVLDEDYAEQYQEVTPGEYVLLAVTDTGTGMPPEMVNRVFEPFFTTKEVGQGSGLGLSMVYGFVKQSGGHVSIYSQVGQGTSVKLYLPRGAMAPAQPEERSLDMPLERFGEKVVLIVEDEAKLRKLAVKMLDQLGLRSVQAETAKDALELLADTHVDVLFTDIELPGGMNGTELAEAAQKLAPNIKVLLTTGYAREAVLHDRWLQKKVPWLLKPYSHTELARELKALLAPTVH